MLVHDLYLCSFYTDIQDEHDFLRRSPVLDDYKNELFLAIKLDFGAKPLKIATNSCKA